MRRGDVTHGFTAVAVIIALAAGCATPAPPKSQTTVETVPAPVPPSGPTGPIPTPVTPPAPPTPPPTPSIGPRPDVTQRPERIEITPAPPPAPTAPPVAPAQRGKFVVLNFDNADIETVIHAASEIVGFNYVLAPDVRGKVTVQTSGRIPQEDVFGVLLAILEVNGFTAVKSGNLYKIVRIEGARERAVPTIIGAAPDASRTADEIITQIVPLRFSGVNDVANLVRPLMSTRGALIAHRETNVLIITDTASNVRRLLDIVHLVDVEVAVEELQIIPIRFADAADLASILSQLFTGGRLRGGATPAAGAPPAPPAAPVAPGAAPRPAGQPAGSVDAGGSERPPLILAERRSNSLIIHARRSDLETIKKLIGQLDTDVYGGRRVFIYYAENAKSKDLAATLNAIYTGRETTGTTGPSTTPRTPGQPTPPLTPPTTTAPGGPIGGTGTGEASLIEGQVRFIADETTNAVIVTTHPRNWAEIEVTIKQLDRMPRQVLIEVLVAEITLTDDLRLGIDWAVRAGRFNLANPNINGGTSLGSPTSLLGPVTAVAGLPAAGLTAWTFATNQFFAMLNTLAAQNKVNILSNPHVLTSENKKAVINVSNSVPIITSQQVPIGGTTSTTAGTTAAVVGTQTVEYRDAGVVLTVTPRIGERGTVALDVKQEVNSIGANQPPSGSPIIIKREAETSVVLSNNQTLVLGGLIQETRTTNDQGLPYLKNIPILGYLFGAKTLTINKTELVLLITPRVIGTALDAARITDSIRRATPELDDAVRQVPRPPSATGIPAGPPQPAPSAPAPPGPATPPAVPTKP
jgi:general secretion pathway protein D